MTFQFDIFPVLKSKRLVLREVTVEDREQVFFLRTDQEVNKYIYRQNRHKSIEEAEAFIIKITEGTKNGENINWGITIPTFPEIIGTICLWNFSKDRKRAELGYDLHPDHQGKGYMSEALNAVLNYAFNELHLEEVEAYTEEENESSKILLVKNHFRVNPNKSDSENERNVVYHRIKPK